LWRSGFNLRPARQPEYDPVLAVNRHRQVQPGSGKGSADPAGFQADQPEHPDQSQALRPGRGLPGAADLIRMARERIRPTKSSS